MTPSIDGHTSDWLNMIRGKEKSFLSQENSEVSSLEFRVHFTKVQQSARKLQITIWRTFISRGIFFRV